MNDKPVYYTTPEYDEVTNKISQLRDAISAAEATKEEIRAEGSRKGIQGLNQNIRAWKAEIENLKAFKETLPQPKMGAAYLLEVITEQLNENVKAYKAAKEDFVKKMQDNPIYYLGWRSEYIVKAQVIGEASANLLEMIDELEEPSLISVMGLIAGVKDRFTRDVQGHVTHPSVSTNPASNVIDHYVAAAKGEITWGSRLRGAFGEGEAQYYLEKDLVEFDETK